MQPAPTFGILETRWTIELTAMPGITETIDIALIVGIARPNPPAEGLVRARVTIMEKRTKRGVEEEDLILLLQAILPTRKKRDGEGSGKGGRGGRRRQTNLSPKKRRKSVL